MYSCGTKQAKKLELEPVKYLEIPISGNEIPVAKVEPEERKIIKSGTITFKTEDVNKTKFVIVQTVQELNGYIESDNAYVNDDKFTHNLTIRVPAEKFDLLLTQISETIDNLENKNIGLSDVTEEYIDVEARINVKKELQNRYIALLKQTIKVDEILNIEKEIGALQEEIESVEGRMKYLKDKVAFSELTVNYYQNLSAKINFFSNFGDGVKKGWGFFLWFLIGVSRLWVFILLAIITIYLVRVLKKRRKRKS
jgi:hypothetical protein